MARICPMEETKDSLGGLTRAQAIDQIWPVFKRIEKLQWTILGIITGYALDRGLSQFGLGPHQALEVLARVVRAT